jgi:hypothetical protein
MNDHKPGNSKLQKFMSHTSAARSLNSRLVGRPDHSGVPRGDVRRAGPRHTPRPGLASLREGLGGTQTCWVTGRAPGVPSGLQSTVGPTQEENGAVLGDELTGRAQPVPCQVL